MTAWKRVALLLFGVVVFTGSASAETPLISIGAKPTSLAENIAVGDRIDGIRFLGMLEIPNKTIQGIRIGQLSDIAWDDNARVLYAVTDKGGLLHLHPTFSNDVLTDVQLIRAMPLRDLKTGQPLKYKRGDAEGLAIVRGANGQTELAISFERFPRIVRYRPDGYAVAEHRLPNVLADKKSYQDENQMLEALCYDPGYGLVTMPEKSLKGETGDYNRLFSLTGRSWRYVPDRDNSVVSLACLGDGEILVLERRFGRFMWNFRTALKRIHLSPTTTDTSLAAETLVSFDTSKGFQIDNFEGLAHHRGKRFFLVSDDNDFLLERTLLLYFEIID